MSDKNRAPDVAPEDHMIAFSRSGLNHVIGTLDQPFKTHLDIDTALRFRKWLADHKTDHSTLFRDVAYKVVHGKTFTEMVEEQAKAQSKINREIVFGTGPDVDQMGSAS